MSEVANLDEVIYSNPYEYLNPIGSSDFFIDRRSELEQALTVCEQVIRGKKGGVLVLGGRASGKTSFLDELRKQLTLRHIASSKIPLNQGLVQSGNEVEFINTVLSELVKATDDAGLLERNYLRKIRDRLAGIPVQEVDIDLPGISFIAKASEAGKLTRAPFVALRDGIDDFMKLLDERASKGTKKGAILVFDEGDVLTTNKDLLQIMRNVFQDYARVGLVVAGSAKLLTQISDVYSPWARGFRKVLLGPYPTNSDAEQAIAVPLESALKELKSKKLEVQVEHRSFDALARIISSKEPMAINVLSHFGYELAAKRSKFENGRFALFMKVDKELMEEVINQLRGSGEYDEFLSELKPEEYTALRLLSRCQRRASIEELTVLLTLHELGARLQSMPVSKVAERIREAPTYRTATKEVLDSIAKKGDAHNINAVTTSLTGLSLFEIEDQWIKSLFTYGWEFADVDLELGVNPQFNGVRVFGDPISTVIHSTLFPRMASWLSKKAGFRAHTGPKDGMELVAEPGRVVVGLNYERTADGISYHLAFEPSREADIDVWRSEITALGSSLQYIGLVDATKVFAKFPKAGSTTR
ncbi:MAG: ATP-binding protein [Nitrososphaerota archaeon]|nr:ATP-binding protein [Nitrososphaerota archaeon]